LRDQKLGAAGLGLFDQKSALTATMPIARRGHWIIDRKKLSSRVHSWKAAHQNGQLELTKKKKKRGKD
jgi:hypothetical protein